MVTPLPVNRSSASSLSGVDKTCEPSFCTAASLIMWSLALSKRLAHRAQTQLNGVVPGAFARISFCRSSESEAKTTHVSWHSREQTAHTSSSPAVRSDEIGLSVRSDSCGVIDGDFKFSTNNR